jgi:hypothetical protein
MSIVGDILRAAIERSQKANADQLQHVKDQSEALAENTRKPLWQHRLEQLKAAMKPPETSDD